MLLILPRINDYAVGFTMLGLGDIILPGKALSFSPSTYLPTHPPTYTQKTGLLVAFAARYDRAKGTRLFWGQGSYFRLMVIGYAVGLMMANIAVYLMKMGYVSHPPTHPPTHSHSLPLHSPTHPPTHTAPQKTANPPFSTSSPAPWASSLSTLSNKAC